MRDTPGTRAKSVGELVHTDTHECSEISRDGCIQQLMCVDDCSRFGIVYNMRSKKETAKYLDKFRSLLAQHGHTVRKWRSDNGKEYFNKVVDLWCTEHAMVFEPCAPHRHHQNGTAERFHQTIRAINRSCIADMQVGRDMWGHATTINTFVRNVLPNGEGNIPYTVVTGRTFDHESFRCPFSKCYPMV